MAAPNPEKKPDMAVKKASAVIGVPGRASLMMKSCKGLATVSPPAVLTLVKGPFRSDEIEEKKV